MIVAFGVFRDQVEYTVDGRNKGSGRKACCRHNLICRFAELKSFYLWGVKILSGAIFFIQECYYKVKRPGIRYEEDQTH